MTSRSYRSAQLRTPSMQAVGDLDALAATLRRFGWLVLPALVPLGLLALWQGLTVHGVLPAQVLVPPSRVLATFDELVRSGDLWLHLKASLLRLAVGFGTGAGLGLVVGLALGIAPRFAAYVLPIFQAARQVPSIALLPILILAFGVDETFKLVLVSKACFFPVALAALHGVQGIPRQYREVAAVYRLPRTTLLTKLVVPATLPPIVAGVRISLGRSWLILVAAELMAADKGIGQMMEMARQMFRMDIVMVGVALTGSIGLALDLAVRLAERLLTRGRNG